MQAMPGYSVAGTGPGILLLHSSMSSRGQWRSLAAELARDHTVVAVDLYGCGEAPMPLRAVGERAEFSLADEAARLTRIADTCFGKGAPFLLAGHSYGGAAALHIARACPARITGLVAYEPVCFNLLDEEDSRDLIGRVTRGLRAHVAAGRMREGARLFFDFWNGPDAFQALPEAVQERFAAVAPKVVLDFQALALEPMAPRAYQCIEAPVLLLGGTRSFRATRRILERLVPAMPNAALRWMEGDHMAPVTDPQRINPVIARFARAVRPCEEALAA